MPITTQQSAITAVQTAVDAVGALTGRVYDGQKPDPDKGVAVVYPYAEIYLISDSIGEENSVYGGGTFPTLLFQVDLFTDRNLGSAAARVINEAVFNAIHNQKLGTNKFDGKCISRGTWYNNERRILVISQFTLQTLS